MKITEKDIGRKFKTRSGRVFVIVAFDNSSCPVHIMADGAANYLKGGANFVWLSSDGFVSKNAENGADFAEWVTEQNDDKMDEQDRYELRMTVVDAKGSATTYKKYLPSLAGLREIVDKKTGGIIDVGSDEGFNPLLFGQLKSKADVVKITRQVNALGANLATLTIRVTQLRG